MKRIGKAFVAFLLAAYFHTPVFSQQTMVYHDPEATYRDAVELFTAFKFAWAREKFLDVSEQIGDPDNLLRIRAEYYAALCGYELFNNNTEESYARFIGEHPVSSLEPMASLQLAKLSYRRNNFRDAVAYFGNADRSKLSRREREEYDFKLGYSYLRINNTDKAEQHLTRVANPESVYGSPAIYYVSHIAYLKKDYPKALKGFARLTDDATFKGIVPYYIVHIHYLQGNYRELLERAPSLLETSNPKRAPEIARMIGEAYYQTGKFREALPYLKQYEEKTGKSLTRGDAYQLGYASYQSMQYEQAISHLAGITGQHDSLSQNASYHLGDCYVKTGQKKYALSAFYAAYKEGPDPVIREDALFSYAKLSYELGYNPYNEAAKALKQYISEYPSSSRLDEANTYLTGLFMSARNYKDALEAISNIQQKDARLREAQQRLLYFRGIEEFNAGNFKASAGMFEQASKEGPDKQIRAESAYWKAEAFYRMEAFDIAAEGYKDFQLTPGAFSLPVFPYSNYNLGYCYFKQKAYGKALVEFRKLTTNKVKVDDKVLNDAYLRTGDCFFVTHAYEEAVEAYDNALKLRKPDADYALFQKAMAQGAAGKYQAKVASLHKLTEDFTKSSYQPEARYELGLTYLVINEQQKALSAFNGLISAFPKNFLVKNALLRKGLIHYNADNDEEALKTFKKVVSDFPGTPESKEALVSIRNIYVDLNKVDDFFVYAKNIPFASVSNTEQDSITYLAAENRYLGGDCTSSSEGFKNYLDKFPGGIFLTNARFYLAECLFRQNRPEESLPFYLEVISAPQSKFTETALLSASNIYFSKKNFTEALRHFQSLLDNASGTGNVMTAQTGIMRCNRETGNHEGAITASRALLANEQVTDEIASEAHLTIANAAMQSGQESLAKEEFEKTYKMTKNEKGAEAKHKLALIQFNDANYKEAEKIIFEFINEFPSQDYWLARSFILLADVYVKTDNIFQAKQTLRSIIDNYEGPDLVQVAKDKLQAIEKKEVDDALKKEEENRKAFEKEIRNEKEGLIEEK